MATRKLKTRKSMAKRIKITATGKVLHVKGSRNNKRSIKSKRTLRLMGDLHEYSPGEARRVRKMVPYK
jgi:large subunit ribosomal protein L35